jgi:hypothetical protein
MYQASMRTAQSDILTNYESLRLQADPRLTPTGRSAFLQLVELRIGDCAFIDDPIVSRHLMINSIF